jgi:hypothetical protein
MGLPIIPFEKLEMNIIPAEHQFATLQRTIAIEFNAE